MYMYFMLHGTYMCMYMYFMLHGIHVYMYMHVQVYADVYMYIHMYKDNLVCTMYMYTVRSSYTHTNSALTTVDRMLHTQHSTGTSPQY